MGTIDPKHILIMDTDETFCRFAAGLLERKGFFTKILLNGYRKSPVKLKKRFSGVISSDDQPETDFRESGAGKLINDCRRLSPAVPVILVSKNGDAARAVAAMKWGAVDYLIKPIPAKLLIASVTRMIGAIPSNGKPLNHGAEADAINPIRRNGVVREFVAQDPLMKKLLRTAARIAASRAAVLIQGESGTGKEMLAEYIHFKSPRKNAPYIAVNCAALPETLSESELFGHERGAFTGAFSAKPGKFELADGGTLVLDEIGEMPLPLQVKLLRVLQEKEVDRLGGRQSIPVDVRVIAVSNADLLTAVGEGRFREDLYYRINVIPLKVPPLRQRLRDIDALTPYFVHRVCAQNQLSSVRITPETMAAIKEKAWPGNVRELENTITRSVLMHHEASLTPGRLMFDENPGRTMTPPDIRAGLTVRDMERALIRQTLKEVANNRTQAAKLLGISIRTLRNKLNRYQEDRGRPFRQ